MLKGNLPFERPLLELQNKIIELKKFMHEKQIDLSTEIETLEKKAIHLSQKLYNCLTPWQRVQIARHPNRPTSSFYLKNVFRDFFELKGDRLYADDPAIIGGIAYLDDFAKPITVIAHEKGRDIKEKIARTFGMPHPEGYRKSVRLMKQAEKFGRPIVTLIDTQGAYPGIEAEERGQSEAIARSLFTMAGLRVPIICIITGEGGSGGALGLAIGDRLLMLEHAYFSVISPEGAAAILWRDAAKAELAASSLKITSQDLYELGIIDKIIQEPHGGAHNDPDLQASILKKILLSKLEKLQSLDIDKLIEQRHNKFCSLGMILHED